MVAATLVFRSGCGGPRWRPSVGVSGQKLEMLFVDAQQRRKGIGSALMSFVRANCGVTAVDVNQQNAQAVEFYLRHGFTVASRSDLDGQGWPYPVLHLVSSNE